MSNKTGVDDLYRSQAAPARWGQTYRSARRNSRRTYNKGNQGVNLIWGQAFYSERHFNKLSGAAL